MTKLGSYTFDKPLGESPVGLAFAATHVSAPDKPGRFELVRIKATLAMQPEVLAALEDCARRVPKVEHANLVRVYEVHVDGDAGAGAYVVSERRPGRTLDALMEEAKSRGRAIPRPVALALGREVLRGLAALHRAPGGPVVHGGVHPRTVVVGSRGDVRLGGLVAARVIAAASAEEPELLRGCFGYVAPEVALGDPVDARTDVYAAGVLCYQLATGALPPEGVLAPPELDDVLAKALATDPAARYADAAELLAKLDSVLGRGGAAHVSPSDIAAFLAELFGNEVSEKPLPPPQMPLAAPKVDRRMRTLEGADAVISEDDDPTQVADDAQVSKKRHATSRQAEVLNDETDDLLASLGVPAGPASPGETSEITNVDGREDSTTIAGDDDLQGGTYIPPPLVEETPTVLPQGKLIDLVGVYDPSSGTAERASLKPTSELSDRLGIDVIGTNGTPPPEIELPSAADTALARPELPRRMPFPTPAPVSAVELSPIPPDSGSVPALTTLETPSAIKLQKSSEPIAVAMAAARAAAASLPAAQTPEDAVSSLSEPPAKSGSGILILTLVVVVGALVAVLYYKTDLFHPGRAKERQEKQRQVEEKRKKDQEAARPKFGSVVIRSNPDQAAVYLLIGRTPADLPGIDARAPHTFIVEHEGYQRTVRAVKFDEFTGVVTGDAGAGDRLAAVTVTLKQAPPPGPPPKPEKPGKKPKTPAILADSGVEESAPPGPPVKGTIRIDSDPAGASVWLLVGYTGTMALDGLPIMEEHQFRVEAEGTVPEYVVIKPSMWQGRPPKGPFHFEKEVDLKPVVAPTPPNP